MSSESLRRRRKFADFQLENGDFRVEIRVNTFNFAKISACGELHVLTTVYNASNPVLKPAAGGKFWGIEHFRENTPPCFSTFGNKGGYFPVEFM